jgi:hypothetical protein
MEITLWLKHKGVVELGQHCSTLETTAGRVGKGQSSLFWGKKLANLTLGC